MCCLVNQGRNLHQPGLKSEDFKTHIIFGSFWSAIYKHQTKLNSDAHGYFEVLLAPVSGGGSSCGKRSHMVLPRQQRAAVDVPHNADLGGYRSPLGFSSSTCPPSVDGSVRPRKVSALHTSSPPPPLRHFKRDRNISHVCSDRRPALPLRSTSARPSLFICRSSFITYWQVVVFFLKKVLQGKVNGYFTNNWTSGLHIVPLSLPSYQLISADLNRD